MTNRPKPYIRFELVDHVTQQGRALMVSRLADAKLEAERAFNKTGNPQVLRKIVTTTVHIVDA